MNPRLSRLLFLLIAFPAVHFTIAAIDTLSRGYALIDLALRCALELLTIAVLPAALINRRFPTLSEVFVWGIPERIVAVLTLGVFWILASLVIMRLIGFTLKLKRFRWIVAVALLTTVLAPVIISRIPPPTTADIRIDASQVIGTMPDLAQGFSQGGEGQMPQIGYFEQTIPHLRELGAKLVRIDHLYDYYNVLSFADDGTPIYQWDDLDRIVNAILESGAQPYMSLSYAPPAISNGNVYAPPTDLDAWGELVYQTVTYYNVERGLDIRYWEVWNEPNLRTFWDGTLEDYLRLYEVTALAVRRADPTTFVGGAATVPNLLPLIQPHFIASREFVTSLADFASSRSLPLDFVSWHIYDADPAAVAYSVDLHREWTSAYSPAPRLIISEWNWAMGSDPRLDNGRTAAYAAQIIATLADTPLDHAFFFEPIDGHSSWQGGWGMIRADGQVKPIFNAFRLINTLEGDRLAVTTSHPDVGALATHGDDGLNVLLWYNGENHPAVDVTVSLSNLAVDCPESLDVQGVDALRGNTFADPAATDLYVEALTPIAAPDSCRFALSIPQNGIRSIDFR